MKKTIAEILKYCRQGLPLWSPAFGNVKLESCTESNGIVLKTNLGSYLLDAEGMLCCNGECMLFPSKEQRDWDKFWPYKDGDVVALRDEDSEITQLFLFKETVKIGSAYCHVFLDRDDTLDISEGKYFVNCFATKSEEDRLFKALEKNGYRWDPMKKEVVPMEKKPESIENVAAEEKVEKFDINTLKPFDRVLVRDNDGQRWTGDLFLCKTVSSSYEGVYSLWNQCIPYEGNETLLGTTKQPDEYYITWEEEK